MSLIDCRDCDSSRCDGCNIYILATMLNQGKLDCLMDDHHTITIDPEELRPKGRWEMRGGKLYCTHCGERAAVARDSEDFWYTKGTPACPNCGCRMDGGNE